MNIHNPKYKRKIYERYYEELTEIKLNLEYIERSNQRKLKYKVIKQENNKRKFGTPILSRLWKIKNTLKSSKKRKMEMNNSKNI